MLARMLQRVHSSTDATHFIQAARRAALHISKFAPGLVEAFNEGNPAMWVAPCRRPTLAYVVLSV